ncbi:hypothetical protein GQ457_08G031900 [Hibiscus cannabinus]
MNSGLLAAFTTEEVIAAFRDINPRKSPGIDGLPSGFFRQRWDILGEDFVSLCLDLLRGHADMASVNETVIVLIPKVDKPTSMRQLRPISLCTVIYKTVSKRWDILGDDFVSLCLDLLRGRAYMASVNETVIVLIPKVDKPTSMRQLRPISLCTVIYKTISKVLVNRMKYVLPNCISSTQAAFVQGHAITDIILDAHELVHTLHTSVSRSSQGAVFKLDMERPSIGLSGPFLRMVRLRGTLSEAFLPRRGLRQGDPLSPFLFLFCTEGLSTALTEAQREGRLPGVRACKHGPPVNHLLFANDSLVFLQNDMSEVHYLKDILSTYSVVSGQKVNFSKSTAYFSPRTPPEHWVAVHEALGVQEVLTLVFTLGFPSLSGRISMRLLAAIAIRWTLEFPSGPTFFSPSVVMRKCPGLSADSGGQGRARPVDGPLCAVTRIEKEEMLQHSRKDDEQRDAATLPKAAGGMGFKDLHLFNIALLGKQLWHLLSEPGSLLYRTFRAKYFPDGDMLHASVPARSSFAWKGFHCALSRLRDGFYWTMGIDSQVCMFRDRWGSFSPVTLNDNSADNEELPLRCRDFMVPGQPLKDHSKLSARLSPADVEKIVEVPISSGRVDTLISGDQDSGLYTVRSGYLFLRLPKVRSFGRRCGRDALPVGSRLRDARLSSGACPLCGASLEDTLHALPDCPDSSLALRHAGFDTPLLSSEHDSAVGSLDFATTVLSQRSLALLLTLLWGLWRRRNTWVHEHTLYPLRLVVGNTVSLCHNYVSAFAPPAPSTDVAPSAAALPRWRPPPTGSVKVNVDGAFLPSSRLGAIGVLAHDSSGAVLGGFARPVPALGPAFAVEASALLAGLEYAIARGSASVLVESDAAVLINKLHRHTLDLSLLGGLLAPSRDLLAASHGRFRVGFAPRSANSAAHTLASWACQYNDVISFTSVCPELLSRIILDDLSSSF